MNHEKPHHEKYNERTTKMHPEDQAELTIDLLDELEKLDLNVSELTEAYALALGANPKLVEGRPPREEVRTAAQKMEEFIESGMPANEIGEIIAEKRAENPE